LGLFFTTALMTLLVEVIRFDNVFAHEYGVVDEESIMFIFSAFIVPIIWLVNPWYLYNEIKRKMYFGHSHFNQKEANRLMEKPHFSIGKRYAELIETIWFTYLYSSIIPLGSILVLFYLSIFYWIDKYNLLKKSSVI